MVKLSFFSFVLIVFGLVSTVHMSPTVSIVEPEKEMVAVEADKNTEDAETLKTANNFGIGYYPFMPPMYDEFYGIPRPTYTLYDGYRYGSYSKYSRYNAYKTYSTFNTPIVYQRPIYAYWR